MKLRTHFKIENERQLELVYQDLKDQFTDNFRDLIRKFREDGTRTISCNSVGMINLDDQPIAESKLIPNPYAENVTKTVEGKVEKTPEKTLKAIPTDDRRKRIDTILDIINLEIEKDKLDKLIEVLDLESINEGHTSLDAIFQLKD